MRLQGTATALVLIDVQNGFDHPRWGSRNNPQAEDNIARILASWRRKSWPVFHVKHDSLSADSPLRPGQSGNDIKGRVQPLPEEPVLRKYVNSAFIGTSLERQLRNRSIDGVVLVGLTTPHCVSTTARMAGNLGFAAVVVSDATAAFDITGPDGRRFDAELIHVVSLATLSGEFAQVLDTAAVMSHMDDT